jgi:2-keto-4-pentenoate hydratase
MDAILAERAARYLWGSHRQRADYGNLPPELRPDGIDQAYAIQDAFHALATPSLGPIAGWKIATTTKVMQQLMGIDRPCAGAIFERTIHRSPARLAAADYVSLKVECEIAFRLARDLRREDAPFTIANVQGAIESVMPAFELVDDRHAVYRETAALSLIADNCWNQGVVLGEPVPPLSEHDLNALQGRLEAGGRPALAGKADGPLGALAWVANVIATRGHGLRRGMIVMTGSLIPTTAVAPGESARFAVEGLGEARLTVA